MKLYELDKAMAGFELQVDEDGVITNAEELDKLEMELKTKQENVGLYIKNLKAEAEAIQDEEKRLSQRRAIIDKQVEWYKGYLAKSLNGEKINTPRLSVSYRKSEAVNIVDESKLPEDYWRIKREVDKTSLKKALKSGSVEGAELIKRQNIIIK